MASRKSQSTVTAGTAIPETNRCDHVHGLVERPVTNQSYEQKWCGTWEECPYCSFARVTPSSDLTVFLATQKDKIN